MGELKPKLRNCPFCGGEAFCNEYLYSCEPGRAILYTVECDECHATTFEYGSKQEAIKTWNRRAEDGK